MCAFRDNFKHLVGDNIVCILVKGLKGSSWSFPRGKKNKDEEDHTCAIREVLEETSFDVTKLLNIDDYIELMFGQQKVRLYIVVGVREDTEFAPLTKKEISEIAWHRLDDLQAASGDVISHGITGLKLYMVVSPFLTLLKSWIFKNQPLNASRPDISLRGPSVWRAKNSSTGSSNMIMESQSKPEPDVHLPDIRPGKSFRNFRFNTAPIFQPLNIM